MGSAEQESTEKPFERRLDERWVEDVDNWVWTERDESTYSKSGPCPHCGHLIGFVETPTLHLNLATAETAVMKGRRFQACNCGVAHPGAAEGETGCGHSGQIERAEQLGE